MLPNIIKLVTEIYLCLFYQLAPYHFLFTIYKFVPLFLCIFELANTPVRFLFVFLGTCVVTSRLLCGNIFVVITKFVATTTLRAPLQL